MADALAPTEEAEAVEPPASSRTWWRIGPIGVGALVVLLVIGAGLGYRWWADQPERHLGDHGEVIGRVSQDCRGLWVHVDGLNLGAADRLSLPTAWRGQEVRGRLEVVKVVQPFDTFRAVFTADDGTSVAMVGAEGGNGHFYFTADCAMWAGG